MMPLFSVAHSVGRLARKFVQPLMHPGVRFAKTLLRLGAMLFKGWHISKDTKPVKFIREIRAIRG
jgi:hypothetical protein